MSLTRGGGLREAVRSWVERCRRRKIARKTKIARELINDQGKCIERLEVQRRQLIRRCEEMGSEAESASRGGWLRAKEEVLQQLRQEMQQQEHERVKKERLRQQSQEHDRRVQEGKKLKEDNYERQQLHSRLESLLFQCKEHSGKERELEDMLKECGPSWLQGLIGSRLKQGFRSWVQELKDRSKKWCNVQTHREGGCWQCSGRRCWQCSGRGCC